MIGSKKNTMFNNRLFRINMKKILHALLPVLTVFSAILAHGQDKMVTGRVTDESGSLPGANIVIEGTTTGTVTDLNGQFSIQASPSDVLVFSYVGYVTVTVPVGEQQVIDVIMREDQAMLEELVVVGYGSLPKSDLTGAVSSVKVPDNLARESVSVEKLLAGRAAGVTVVSNSGNPGEANSVRIRGSNSLRGNNEPLYVIDGVVVTTAGEGDNSATSDANESQQSINGLAGINPADIESMEILKDASATAIYGSRGANGVVLITTKQGSKGKSKTEGFVSGGISYVSKKLPVLSGADYARYRNETGLMNGESPSYHIVGDQVYGITYVNNSPVINEEPYLQVNWQDEIYQPGLSFNAGASASGGGDNGNYYVSTNFNNVGGIVENSKIRSGNFRINVSQDVSDDFSVDARISLYTSRNDFAQSGSRAGSNRSFIRNLITYNPLVGDDVEDFQNDLELSNPYSWINDFEDVTKDFRGQASLKLTYNLPVRGLKFQVRGAADLFNRERRRWYGLTTFAGDQYNGRLTMSTMNRLGYVIDNLLLYNRTFKKKHKVNATVGYVYDHRFREDISYEVVDFVTYEFTIDGPEYGQVSTVPLTTFPRTEMMNSFLGRVNYSFKSKYSLTATLRADGSSKFAKENKYSYFPSFALGWRLSEEEILRNSRTVSNLKLRAGWGLTGNQAINPYQTYGNYGVAYYANPDNTTGIAFAPINISNPDLKWETTMQVNLGLDFGFLRDRIYGAVDLYYKETNDLLQEIALPTSTGYASMLINRGSVSNQGVDLNLTGVVVSTKDAFLSITGNWSLNRNKILKLGIPDSPVYLEGDYQMESYYLGDNISTGQYFKCPANVFMVGQPIGLFFGWQTDGIYQEGDTDILEGFQPGDVKIVDLDGDGEITVADRTILGDPNPDFTYGLNVDFSYKRFSFNMLFYGVYGNDIANGAALRYYYANGDGQNIFPAAYHEAWRPDSPSDEYARIGFSEEKFAAITDRIIEKGSYFRLNNLLIGYEIPLEKMKKFQVYASVQNLFTITGYSGYEPNITSFLNNGNIQGVDWNEFPNARTYMVGLNVSF